MSRLVARILLAILLFPAAIVFYLIAFLIVERTLFNRDDTAILVTLIPGCAFMIAYWVLLWRRAVNWTPGRVWQTLWSAGGAAVAGVLIGIGIRWVLPWEHFIGTFLGTTSGLLLWIIGTIFIWRESEAERAARLSRAGADAVVCPSCGYNLTGLRESRCPECGTQFTLNELLAAQPARAAAELEKA